MSSSARVGLESTRIEPQETSCLQTHKVKLITALAVAAIGLMVAGGTLYYFSILENVICFSLMGAGGAVGLGAVVTALILYHVCLAISTIKTAPQDPKATSVKIRTTQRPPQVPLLVLPQPNSTTF